MPLSGQGSPSDDGRSEAGWGGRIRTYDTRYQKPLPYHLATPQSSERFTRLFRRLQVRSENLKLVSEGRTGSRSAPAARTGDLCRSWHSPALHGTTCKPCLPQRRFKVRVCWGLRNPTGSSLRRVANLADQSHRIAGGLASLRRCRAMGKELLRRRKLIGLAHLRPSTEPDAPEADGALASGLVLASKPEHDGCGQCDGSEEDLLAAVISRRDTPPVLEPAEHDLDHCPAVRCAAISREGGVRRLYRRLS